MLKISALSLYNFRSYDSFELEDIGDLTVFAGPNASGKTNALEALHLLTALSSFRNAMPTELIGRGSGAARAKASLEGDGRMVDIELKVEDGKRRWLQNGKPRPAKQLKGTLPSIAFTPDDLQIVKGSDKRRRRELDMLGSQLNANYHQIMRDYEKILRQKNSLLKDGIAGSMLDAVNDVFAIVAEQYSHYREALFDRLMPLHSESYAHMAGARSEGETLSGRYERSWAGDTKAALEEAAQEELARGRALIGPHLDKIAYMIDGLDASSFASQGQQRSIVLSLKMAEVDLIEQITGDTPVLLLDDVMSELDASRRSALVQLVSKGSQTFLTTANIDYFDEGMLGRARVVQL